MALIQGFCEAFTPSSRFFSNSGLEPRLVCNSVDANVNQRDGSLQDARMSVKALLLKGFTMTQGLLFNTSVDWDGNFDRSTVAVEFHVVSAVKIPPVAAAAASSHGASILLAATSIAFDSAPFLYSYPGSGYSDEHLCSCHMDACHNQHQRHGSNNNNTRNCGTTRPPHIRPTTATTTATTIPTTGTVGSFKRLGLKPSTPGGSHKRRSAFLA